MEIFKQKISLPTRGRGSSSQPLGQSPASPSLSLSTSPSNLDAIDAMSTVATANRSQIVEQPWGLKLFYDGNDSVVE